MATFKQSVVKEFIDVETGEVTAVETEKTFTKKVNPDEFYMTFIDYISPFFKLRSEVAKNILIWFCQHAEFNTGQVLLPTAQRARLQEELKISSTALSNSVKRLKDLRLISGDRGFYQINPQIFWKGDLKTREQMLQDNVIQITFSIYQDPGEK